MTTPRGHVTCLSEARHWPNAGLKSGRSGRRWPSTKKRRVNVSRLLVMSVIIRHRTAVAAGSMASKGSPQTKIWLTLAQCLVFWPSIEPEFKHHFAQIWVLHTHIWLFCRRASITHYSPKLIFTSIVAGSHYYVIYIYFDTSPFVIWGLIVKERNLSLLPIF